MGRGVKAGLVEKKPPYIIWPLYCPACLQASVAGAGLSQPCAAQFTPGSPLSAATFSRKVPASAVGQHQS